MSLITRVLLKDKFMPPAADKDVNETIFFGSVIAYKSSGL